MPVRGAIVPPPGNPMRPIFMMFAVFFPMLLIGFPLYVYATGGPVGETIAILWLLGVVALISLGTLVWSSHAIEQERRKLASAEMWATWQLSDDEYHNHVRAEWRRDVSMAAGILAIVFAVIAFAAVESGDPKSVMLTIIVALVTVAIPLAMGLPTWHANERTRVVRIGANGVEAMGHYVPLRGAGRGLEAVALRSGDPSLLVFRTYVNNRRSYEVRVPIPADRMDEARQIMERFAPTPPVGETYPELLRRTRERSAQ